MTWTAVQIYEYWSMFGVEMTGVLASKSRVSWSHTLIPTGTDKTASAVRVGLVQLIKHSTLYTLCHLLWLSCESWSSRISFKIFKVPGNELWHEYIWSAFSVSGCEIFFFFFLFFRIKKCNFDFLTHFSRRVLKGMHFISWKPKNSNKLIADDDNQPTKNNLTLKLMKKVIH